MSSEPPIVLVIDDEPSVCIATKRVLRSAGYQVRTFESSQQVFTHGRPNGPCCLVLDFSLPEENGLEFQKRLLDSGIRVPIVFISGHGDIPISVKAIRAGAMDFLPKPYDATQLLAAVAKALEEDVRQLASSQHTVEMREHYASLTAREREV